MPAPLHEQFPAVTAALRLQLGQGTRTGSIADPRREGRRRSATGDGRGRSVWRAEINIQTNEGTVTTKHLRGFALLDRTKRRQIASKGGKAAHAKGVAHEWSSEQARLAGRKGGLAHHARRMAKTAQTTQTTL